MAEDMDVEAMWKPAIRNYQGHAVCDQKIAAMFLEIEDLKKTIDSLEPYIAILEQDNNHLRGVVEDLRQPTEKQLTIGDVVKVITQHPRKPETITRHNPEMDPDARGKAAR
jgi:hypothetical protein